MNFKQLGIVLMIGGFLAGHLMTNLALRAAERRVADAGDLVSTADAAKATFSAYNYAILGDIVSLLGLVIYLYGVITARALRQQVIDPPLIR